MLILAVMAQQAEHVLGKDEVTGSNPVNSSKNPVRVSEWDFTFYFFTLHFSLIHLILSP